MKIEVEVDYKVSPEELAVAFCDMDCGRQAEFFNAVAREVKGWPGSFAIQLQAVTDEKCLTDAARYIMFQIGAYGPLGSKSEDSRILDALDTGHEPGSWP